MVHCQQWFIYTTISTGIECTIPICYGVNGTDTNSVCNGHGNCHGPDTCICSSLYTGTFCNITTCYSILSDDISTCSSNGHCVDYNVCECSDGNVGDNCELKTCSGRNSSDPMVCNGRGLCNEVDNCTCNNGFLGISCELPIPPIPVFNCSSDEWTGTNCSIPICFGLNASDILVCNGNGACSKPDNCTCNIGNTGQRCELLDNGNTDGHVANCTVQWTGDNCTVPICFGLNASNPLVCNGNGTCNYPDNCTCISGLTGLECEKYINSEVNPEFIVNCTTGWTGTNCSIPVCFGLNASNPLVCSGNGTCNRPDNCTCISGIEGAECDQITDGIGVVVANCTTQWTGDNCTIPICHGRNGSDPLVCHGNGTCDRPDNCTCSNGFIGETCEFIVKSNETIHENCTGADSCNCTTGWTGYKCSVPICFGFNTSDPLVCSGKGTCDLPDNCTCAIGWTGLKCETTIDSGNCTNLHCTSILCFGRNKSDPLVCSGRGSCIDVDNCTCEYNVTGVECELNIDTGSRNDTNCTDQWTGANCTIPICLGLNASNPLVCSGRGMCNYPDNCTCYAGYTGDVCELNATAVYNDTDASNCTSTDSCNCTTGWTGYECSVPICFGFNASHSFVCSGRGRCIEVDNCTCNSDYFGQKCELDTNMTSNGTVVNCTSEWTGVNCSIPICFGLNASNVLVCSGNGSCIGPDNCTCDTIYTGQYCESINDYDDKVDNCTTGWIGTNCSIPICFGLNASNPLVCNGNGTCDHPENCTCIGNFTGLECDQIIGIDIGSGSVKNCTSEWIGTNCTIPICFGLNASDPVVCSGNGTCISPDNCTCIMGQTGLECNETISTDKEDNNATNCTSGLAGENCTIPICFGMNASDIMVCSGNGSCIEPNNCSCYDGFTGVTCELKIAKEMNYTETNCTSEWTGSNCTIPICFGSNASDPHVCSGNGVCIAPNNCTCDIDTMSELCERNSTDGGECISDQWTGVNCSIPICYGRNASDSRVCSGNGYCNFPDNCTCDSTSTGSNCEFFLCYGIHQSVTSVCSGSGTCIDGDTCDCDVGYSGTQCEHFNCNGTHSWNTTVCYGRGVCLSADLCNCTSGYIGEFCEKIECWSDQHCSGHGVCNQPNNCTCDQGYIGQQCQTHTCYTVSSLDASTCSGNGKCIDLDTCECNAGWVGTECEIPVCFKKRSDDGPCNSQGICTAPDTCVCDNAFIYGLECNMTSCQDMDDCHRNGRCTGVNQCTCNNGWSSPDCSTFNCNDQENCNGNGDCVDANSCRCYNGYGSTNCVPICYGTRSNTSLVCSSHGDCTAPNLCKCFDGYVKQDCSVSICYSIRGDDGSVCSGNGECKTVNQCKCDNRYFGQQCEYTTCSGIVSNDTSVCSGRGSCIGYNQCICNEGYTGTHCDKPICNGKASDNSQACSSRGTCNSPNFCSCKGGYSGSDCEVSICYGILSSDTQVCSGYGICVSSDTCSCKYGWSRYDCSTPTCNSIPSTDSSVCSKHGECYSPDKCECSSSYTGTFCEYPICYERSSIDPTVCSGNGKCSAPDTCGCIEGYIGDKCQDKDPNVFTCSGRTPSDSRVCSKHGVCVAQDVCNCDTDYIGSTCQYSVCFNIRSDNSLVCSGHGICDSANHCTCSGGYFGDKCLSYTCYGVNSTDSSVCSSKGECTAPDICVCEASGRQGNCSSYKCGQYSNQDPRVCSGRGYCFGPNSCSCNSNNYGDQCQYTTCFGLLETDSGVCNGNGMCNSTDQCVCNPGYLGSNCEVPTCYGIRADSSSVCNSNGQCTELDSCKCRQSDVSGYFDGDKCDKCLSNYRTYPTCKTKFCSYATTCSGKGVCGNNYECQCFNSTSDGFYAPPYCRECLSGFYGESCTTRCDSAVKCNSHGECTGAGDTCSCYDSEQHGYYTGTTCDRCIANVYGYPLCKTFVPKNFVFSDDGAHADGTWKTPVTRMKCSDIIHPSDLILLGSGAICGNFGSNGEFRIIFGSDATINPGNNVRFNVEFSNPTTTPVYRTVTIAAPAHPFVPTAEATCSDVVSVCDGQSIDGSTSTSYDGRPLKYIWSALEGSNLANLNSYLRDQSEPILHIPSDILVSGSYIIQLEVVTFLGASDFNNVTFQKLSYAVAVAELYGEKVRTVAPSEFFRLDGIGIIGHCFYSDRTLIFTWRQLSGRTLKPRSVAAGLLFDVGTVPSIAATYKYELTVQPVANLDAKSVTTVTISVVLSNLVASISGGDRRARSNEDLVLDASGCIDPDNIEKTSTFVWDCRNILTNGFCPTQITSVLSGYSLPVVTFEAFKVNNRIPAGTYLFSVAFSKDSRVATASVTIEIFKGNTPRVTFTQVPKDIMSHDARTIVVVAINGVFTRYQWSVNGETIDNGTRLYSSMLVDSQVEIVASDKRLIIAEKYFSLGKHTIRLDVWNGEDTTYVEKLFTVSLPPQSGSVTISPVSGDEITEFTFIASQWSSNNTPLMYQWSVYHKNSMKPITTTAKSISNKFLFSNILPGLSSNNYEMYVIVTVYDSLGGASNKKSIVRVYPVSYQSDNERFSDLKSRSNKLAEMNTYGHNNRALFLIDTLSTEISDQINSRDIRAIDYTALITTLAAKIDSVHRSIDSMNPLDTSYFKQLGNSIDNIVTTRVYDQATGDILFNLLETAVEASKNPLHTDLAFDATVAEPYVSAISGLLKDSTSDRSQKADNVISSILHQMGSVSDGRLQSIAKPGVTITIGRFLVQELNPKIIQLSQIQQSTLSNIVPTIVVTTGVN
jgi:hypothetical protein